MGKAGLRGDAMDAGHKRLVDDFELFARAASRYLVRMAYDLCVDWHEAEDLAQTALVQLFARWEALEDRDRLATYARTTLLRVYLKERRRLRHGRELSFGVVPDVPTPGPPVDDRLMLVAALEKLDVIKRNVIVLRFWGDLTVEQTAAVLACSPSAVVSQTREALNMLRVALERA